MKVTMIGIVDSVFEAVNKCMESGSERFGNRRIVTIQTTTLVESASCLKNTGELRRLAVT